MSEGTTLVEAREYNALADLADACEWFIREFHNGIVEPPSMGYLRDCLEYASLAGQWFVCKGREGTGCEDDPDCPRCGGRGVINGLHGEPESRDATTSNQKETP